MTNLLNNRVIVICGAFGSGKSEYSINLALAAVPSKFQEVALVDLDIVNAYFRIRQVSTLLSQNGIRGVIPNMEHIAQSDLPILGPGIAALIKNQSCQVIIDVGGDDIGANALRPFHEDLKQENASVVMVINPFRPLTSSVELIIAMKTSIELTSGLKITALVSNPNLATSTNIEQFLTKHQLVKQAADEMKLPLQEILVYKNLYQTNHQIIDILGKVRPLEIYLAPKWLQTGDINNNVK